MKFPTSMKALLAATCLLAGAVPHARAEEASDAASADSNVLVLTAKNFDDHLKENPLIMVEFYAPCMTMVMRKL